MGRVQTADSSPVVNPSSPSRLPLRAHFHGERETSGYEAEFDCKYKIKQRDGTITDLSCHDGSTRVKCRLESHNLVPRAFPLKKGKPWGRGWQKNINIALLSQGLLSMIVGKERGVAASTSSNANDENEDNLDNEDHEDVSCSEWGTIKAKVHA